MIWVNLEARCFYRLSEFTLITMFLNFMNYFANDYTILYFITDLNFVYDRISSMNDLGTQVEFTPDRNGVAWDFIALALYRRPLHIIARSDSAHCLWLRPRPERHVESRNKYTSQLLDATYYWFLGLLDNDDATWGLYQFICQT